jgi:3-hydroxyacyl-CoA dehydrogenase
MGAGIAGQVANAGIDVLLLDLPSDGDDVNAVAQRGLDRLQHPAAPGVMDSAAAARISIGNIRDDLHRVADCDWVAEAVVERLEIKHQLYRDLESHLTDHAILSSNTSTIPIRLLTEGMSDSLRERFAITHFFNPVRFMRLLELVRGEHTRDDVMQTLSDFCEQQLGKGVVDCADTPGFLANRVGCFAIQCALHEAVACGLPPHEADAIFGRPMGIPKTGVFGLYDLIGIDLMSDVAKSLVGILPEGDAFHAVGSPLPQMVNMINNGQTGNKGGQGFYRKADNGKRQVFDFKTESYVDFDRPSIAIADDAEKNGVNVLLDDSSDHGDYAWKVLSQTLAYAAELIPEVGNDPLAIDDAMKLGYNWIKGPFELIDEIGPARFARRLEQEQRDVPAYLELVAAAGDDSRCYRVEDASFQRQVWQSDKSLQWQSIDRGPGVGRLMEIRNTLKPVTHNASASWFEYNNVAVVEFHTKANALDGDSMKIIADALDAVPQRGLKGLVVHNDAQHFSCGVNLTGVRDFYQRGDWDGLDAFLDHFQQTCLRMAQADFPVVAAPVGMSLGGGFEVVLHAQQVIAHANSVTGLVEAMVGLVPSGGGCKEALYRWKEKLNADDSDISEAAWKAFMNIGTGKTCSSPQLAKDEAMLRQSDTFLMNRDRLLDTAVELVHQGKVVHHERPDLHMPGRDSFSKMTDWRDKAHASGKITEHDSVVGRAVATVVSGGDIEPGTLWSEQDLFDAERRVFVELAKTEATQARINSMLDTGQTVRN